MLPPFPDVGNADEFRVLGVDTALRSTGLAVVAGRHGALRAVWHGTVRIPTRVPLSACLLALREALQSALAALSPAAVAIEGIFFCKYAQTALLLGHARGVVIATCAEAGIAVYEYAPRRVKQAVVGHGSAPKEQMQRTMRALLHLDALPPEDESDALALAVCHLHNRSGVAALMDRPL